MAKPFSVVSTAIVVAILAGVLGIFAYNISRVPKAEERKLEPAGPRVAVGPLGLAVPVAGFTPDQLVDTFTQARAGGARVHDAIDIMAPAGTPVVAAAPGMVEKLFFSRGGGGISAYVRSADGRWCYYYAHLQDYAPGLKEGQRVERGQLIGRVGSTGNASPAGPHLHFAIARLQPGEKWYQGQPVNPYPLLAGKRASG
jgi:murein DD-endopeptidase MepM/ murein hydrolase activator NlpD